jgi:hypothetical protein
MKNSNNSENSHPTPQNLIVGLPVQNLDGRGFRGLLSEIAVHVIVGMRKKKGLSHQKKLGHERDRRKWRTLDFDMFLIS